MLESGLANVENKDQTQGRLNIVLGVFSLSCAPAEATKYFSQAFQYENLKNDASIYALLADLLLRAQYAPLRLQYSQFTTPAQRASPAAEPVRVKIGTLMDQAIDALARAVALAGSNPNMAQDKAVWMQLLRDLYTFRNSGFETGLSEYIDGVLAKPLLLLRK